MTPLQQTEYIIKTVREARQHGMTRGVFVSMLNRLWDAIEGAEKDAEERSPGAPEENGRPSQ